MTRELRPTCNPTTDFDGALSRFARLAGMDGPEVDRRCVSTLLHHGRPTSRAFVLYHGFTNCPAQWRGMAGSLYEQGHTVLVPRAPGHGRLDQTPDELTGLTAADIVEYVDATIDICAGLASRLCVVGFSFGGVCAAWAAKSRSETDEVVLVSPSFLPWGYPLWSARWLPSTIRMLPERYLWWDPLRQAKGRFSPYGYPRLSRRGIGSVFELGFEAWHGEPHRQGNLSHAALVLNERDIAINQKAAQYAFDEGIAPLATSTELYRFGASLRYPHDLIDPEGPNAAHEPDVRDALLGVLAAVETS